MKYLKDIIHKISIIRLSAATILEIDRSYLFLLASSMLLSMVRPFLDLYLVRNVVYLAFEEKNQRAALICLLFFVAAMVALDSLKSLVMWHRSNHYVCFGHYFDMMNSRKTLNIDYETLQEKETQDIIVRAARGCSAVARVGEFASDLISNLIQMLGAIAIMIPLCRFYVIFFILGAILCYKADRAVKGILYENEKKGDTAERRIDYFLKVMLDSRCGKEIRLFKAAPLFKKKYESAEVDSYSLQSRSNIAVFLGASLNVFVTAGEIMLAYALASNRFLAGRIGISDISLGVSSVTVFVAAFDAMFSNLASIGLMENRMNDFRVYQNMEVRAETKDVEMEDVKTENAEIDADDFVIEFKDVSFSYQKGERECLHNINLTIHKGDRIAIFGENGAGKTTFVKLLLGLYAPTKGEILLNGMDYRHYDTRQYHKLFSTVFQDFVLFAYTLKENIMFGDEPDRERKERLLHIIGKTGLEDRLESLSKGIDTCITQEYDPQGEELSGGEGQRVAIARAWYRQAPIIVMDEPTSAIDPISEEKLFDSISELFHGRTALLISHRMSSVRLCDKVLFFDEGTVSECGTHEELMESGKKYSDMYRMQAKWYVG